MLDSGYGPPGSPLIERRALFQLAACYALLYVAGYVSKPITVGAAAIWPSNAVAFCAFMLLPLRLWPAVASLMLAWELASRPLLFWLTAASHTPWTVSASYALANVATTLGPATLARLFGLFRPRDRFALVISPLWILAVSVGSVPGALLGAHTTSSTAAAPLTLAEVGLWQLSFVLSVGTFGPMVFGMVLGFREPAPPPARAWEGGVVALLIGLFFLCFALLPWDDPLVQPMLFAVPLSWLALRFSRRMTNIAVVIVAGGVLLLAGYGVGIFRGVADSSGWRDVVMSIDVFLVIACGGALLINLLTLKQRALIGELAREHSMLRDHARAIGMAEETARRKTAADLHDGIGQVLAGQSMTLAAMRAHITQPPLAAMLEEAIQASREAQEGLRVMIQDLTPPELDQASPDEMIAWLARFFESRHAFRVSWRVHGAAQASRQNARLIYRCVRELLMNARKHSQRFSADVNVELQTHGVEIRVSDDGVGFDARTRSSGGFGLAQLKERVVAAGGSLEIDSAPGRGCRMTVRLPIRPGDKLPGVEVAPDEAPSALAL